MAKIKKYLYVTIDLASKFVSKIVRVCLFRLSSVKLKGYMMRMGVEFQSDIFFEGGGNLFINKNSHVSIGKAFICRGSGTGIDMGNVSCLVVDKNARLVIGDFFGMSNTSIHCTQEIVIGNHVNIG
jgi:hypothetical protein